jgi:uncharacterized protein
MTLSPDLLAILRCPACMRDYTSEAERSERGKVALVGDVWLVCPDCKRRYPIKDGIPHMLIEEGDRNRVP